MQSRFQCTMLHSFKKKLQSLKQNVQHIALEKLKSTDVKKQKKALSIIGPCTAKSMWLHRAHCSLFGPLLWDWWEVQGPKFRASVVVMLHFCPVGDPVLFLRFLRLKSQIKLIALSLTNFHPLVLWHYAVVDGSLEESKLRQRQTETERKERWL